MSYWVYLNGEDGEPVGVTNHSEGGTYAVGGIGLAELNVTYNYGPLIRKHMHRNGLRWLHGRKAVDCRERLSAAIAELGVERAGDYWAATPGNAGQALATLLAWAESNPNATFEVS